MFAVFIASSESGVRSILIPQHEIILHRDLRMKTRQPLHAAAIIPNIVRRKLLLSDTKSLNAHMFYNKHYKFKRGDRRTRAICWTALTACRSPLLNRSICGPVNTGSIPPSRGLLRIVLGVAGVGVICANRRAALCVGVSVARRLIISSAAVNLGEARSCTWSGVTVTPLFLSVIFSMS